MNYSCPNSCTKKKESVQIVNHGTYYRPSDGRYIKRFKCKTCGKSFSQATFSQAYRQNKRRVNNQIEKLYCARVSMRRIAIILNINKTTVARKIKYLGMVARKSNDKYLAKRKKVLNLQFDDLLTIEHTKCKPLSVTVAVEVDTRKILGCEVSSMPATGHLAKISRKKYGYRPDHRSRGIDRLFGRIQHLVDPLAQISSDKHPFYPSKVQKYFPKADYVTHKGSPSSVVGHGELKKQRFDPIFDINHTLAMLRGNMNRLIRRTWCTTKVPERLEDHLAIYINYHNRVLT